MKDLLAKIRRFVASEAGPTAVEYAALFFLVFLAMLTIITAIGQATAGGPPQL